MTETPGQPSSATEDDNDNNGNNTNNNANDPNNTVAKVPGRRRRRRRNKNTNRSKSPVPSQQENQQSKSATSTTKTPRNNHRHNKSKSPHRNITGNTNNNKTTNQHHYRDHHQQHHLGKPHDNSSIQQENPTIMTVIINRCDLWDSAATQFPMEAWVQPNNTQHPGIYVDKYSFDTHTTTTTPSTLAPKIDQRSVVIARVPYHNMEQVQLPITVANNYNNNNSIVVDTSIPNPHDPTVVHDKYWAQRRRLFSRFDQGIQLDSEGWYSVTPELIADHVAQRVSDLIVSQHFRAKQQQQSEMQVEGKGIVILDAFCGCGGNAIAFGKLPSHIVSQVVCIDTDRSKLQKAAHNASLYNIPKDKLVFVECNSIFILNYCYQNGDFVLDQPTTSLPQYMPLPVMPTTCAGYRVGGLDMLPRHIDLTFLDPPWYV
jgi:16S rRNA G966 N2-methylase RsmD